MSNRSTTGGPRVPYYPEGQAVEAAKHLRLTVTRHLASKASFADVVDAFEIFRHESTKAPK